MKNKPTDAELIALPRGIPLYTTECSHYVAEFWHDYHADIDCCHQWIGGDPTDFDGDIKKIEEDCGGYICLIHDFPRSTSIEDRVAALS